jgi:hypothetical protein
MRRVEQNPDPEMDMIGALRRNYLRLEQRIAALEAELRVAKGTAGDAPKELARSVAHSAEVPADETVEHQVVAAIAGDAALCSGSGQNGHSRHGLGRS